MSELNYKGLSGSAEYSPEDQCYFGKLSGITDLVMYEGETIEELTAYFREAVDEYLGDRRQFT